MTRVACILHLFSPLWRPHLRARGGGWSDTAITPLDPLVFHARPNGTNGLFFVTIVAKKVEDFDFRVNNKCVNRAIFIDTWILNARILEIDIDLSVYPNLWLNRCIGKEMRDGWILSNIIPPVVWVEKFDADLKRMSEGLKRLIPLNLSNYKAISILKFASSVSIQMFDQTGWRVPTSDTRFTCGSCKRKPERGSFPQRRCPIC